MNHMLQGLKKQYIPMVAAGKLSQRKAAALIGIKQVSVWRLKNRYLQYGDKIWTHGNTGKVPVNKKYSRNDIVKFYDKYFSYAPFAVAADYYPKKASYTTVYTALASSGRMSPMAHKPVREKKKHLPRPERPNEGDLIQIDGSRHDWFLNGKKVALHGAIDDATHKIVGLYFCENECLLGYYQLLAQIRARTGGFPRAIYSDRSSCFFVAKESTEKISIQEQLAGIEKAETQWQKTCKALNIELIAAYSPQAKGRIERLWGTLQGRLPYVFRFHNIKTIEEANAFLAEWVAGYNRRFAVIPQNAELHWQKPPTTVDYDYLFSVRQDKKSKDDGTFIYHGFKFKICSPKSSCVNFTLCLNESFGLKAYVSGKYYDVELTEPLCSVVSDQMPEVEKDLIYRYLLADTHDGRASLKSG